jgi:hypothetical protein
VSPLHLITHIGMFGSVRCFLLKWNTISHFLSVYIITLVFIGLLNFLMIMVMRRSSWMTSQLIQTQWTLIDNQYQVLGNKIHLFLGHWVCLINWLMIVRLWWITKLNNCYSIDVPSRDVLRRTERWRALIGRFGIRDLSLLG